MALHQALKSLCFNSGWCYAVFWKLKRRSRMVLTWEDGFYEYQSSTNVDGKSSCPETGGNPLVQGGARHDIEGQIGLAVAQMSFNVYFMGEGIIGRVAASGKHQWVFRDGGMNTLATGTGNAVNSLDMLEKYPSGWEAQFAAGIKTIVVIAVPQGAVQLGSTQMMMENLEWVDHIKSSFGTLQSVSGGKASELLSEGQGVKAAVSVPGLPALNVSGRLSNSKPKHSLLWGTSDSHNTGLQPFAYGFDGGLGTISRSDIQALSSATKPMDSSLALHQKARKTHTLESDESLSTLVPSVTNPSLQTFRALPAVSDVDFESSLTERISPQCIDIRTHQSRDPNNAELRNSLARCSSIDAFGRSQGPEADANIAISLVDQPHYNVLAAFSKGLDSRHHKVVLTSISDVEMQQSKGGHTGSLEPSVYNNFVSVKASSLPRLVGTTEGAAACKQDSMGSAGGKSQGDLQFLGNSVIGGSSQIVPSQIDSVLSCHEDGNTVENLVSGAWDSFETYLASFAQEKENKWDCSFGIGDELSQALGPAFRPNNDKCSSKPLGVDENKAVSEQHTLQATAARESLPTRGSSFVKNAPYFLESKAEPLLDAVVASASCSHLSLSTAADDSFSCGTLSGAKESRMSPPKTTEVTPCKRPRGCSSQECVSQSLIHTGPVDCEASVSNQALSKVFINPQSLNISTSFSPLKAILSSWSEDMQTTPDSTQTSQSRKPEDFTKTTRKRARPGESPRPRPKDRQQIQDRVRELREIVPNGSKCSIDALLEKTIKHMLFLQNVTVHADNLKKNGELKDDVEGGASWAVELGGEDTGHPPILVKNLNQPRQLLVEMFCEEKSHFLEIADMIRSLGLTIIKGVMESRSDKIWARFVVEADRDVHRVEIMMSLVHLLHVNSSSSSSTTVASQASPLSSQLGIDSIITSQTQTQTLHAFQQSSLHS